MPTQTRRSGSGVSISSSEEALSCGLYGSIDPAWRRDRNWPNCRICLDLNPRFYWTTDLNTLLWSSRTCPACDLLCIVLESYIIRLNAGPVPIGIELVNGKLQMDFYVSEFGSQNYQSSPPPSRQSDMHSTGKALTVPVEHHVLSFFVKAGTLYMRFHGFIDRTDAVILTETTPVRNDPLGEWTAGIIRLKARFVPGIVEYTKNLPSNLLVACRTSLVTTTWLPDGKSRSYRNLDGVSILMGDDHKCATYLVLIEVACGIAGWASLNTATANGTRIRQTLSSKIQTPIDQANVEVGLKV